MDPKEWPVPKSWEGVTSRQRDFGDELSKLAAMYSSVIWFRDAASGCCYGQATGFVLDTGVRKLLITNAHVVRQGFCELQKLHENVQFVFGGQEFDLEIVDMNANPAVDLVTIDVSKLTFQQRAPGYWGSSASVLTTFTAPSWPEPPPERGLATLCVGWPGKFRTIEEKSVPQFAGFPLLGMYIDDVGDESFTIPFDRAKIISSDFDPTNRVVDETDFGGISGSPVFAMHRGGHRPLQLIGIVRSYGEAFDLLSCTRADLISVDGKINSKMPRE